MGFWGDLWDSACSLASGVVSAVSSAVSAVGGAIATGVKTFMSGLGAAVSSIASFAAGAVSGLFKAVTLGASVFLNSAVTFIAGTVLGPILGPILIQIAIRLLVKMISKLAEKEEVVEKGEKPEEIGYRLAEAEERQKNHEEGWKRREDFASFKEYYAFLKEQIPDIDEERMKKNKVAYTQLGMQAEVKAISEKYDLDITPDFLMASARAKLEDNEFKAFIDAFKNLGLQTLDVSDFFSGKLSGAEAHRMRDAILDALKLYYPQKTGNDLLMRLNNIGASLHNDRRFMENYYADIQNEYGEELAKARDEGKLKPEAAAMVDDMQKKTAGEAKA